MLSFELILFNDTASTVIYTISLHDALPISRSWRCAACCAPSTCRTRRTAAASGWQVEDRKSTRLNSSHANISYAVFCLKKKKAPEGSELLRPDRRCDD